MAIGISSPQPLAGKHDCDEFDCGEPQLNDWLKRRALANQASGASRTFVVVDDRQRAHGVRLQCLVCTLSHMAGRFALGLLGTSGFR